VVYGAVFISLSRIAQIAFIAIASLGVYSFVRAAHSDHQLNSCTALCLLKPTYADNNRSAPTFELPNLEGKKINLASYLGKGPVVLNFWTKTCKPCLEEMPALGELAQLLKPRGVPVITICTDDGPDDVRDTLAVLFAGKPPPFEVVFDPDTTIVEDKFGTTLYPETWILDKHGIIRARFDGPRRWGGAVALEVIEMLGRRNGCIVPFSKGKPQGPYAQLCGDS
jgi:thiol-disulfide isomerase/thioredoxin